MGLTFANKITVCRILAVPFFVAVILSYEPHEEYLRYVALGIFLFAVISDFIDGYIARVYHQKTKAGAILDPLADKLLLISSFICLYEMRDVLGHVQIPLWLVVAVISRDTMLLLGWIIIKVQKGDFDLRPNLWGKITTVLQMTSIAGTLLRWDFLPIVWYVTLIFTLISGVNYIREGIKILNTETL
jgi:CDP-diacylglycerol--glycerol-3-phosphate 3-phosphatidyltransferase